jgi:4-amino-4-deoxy-L-arabinose transferase-like glycosyltransferase
LNDRPSRLVDGVAIVGALAAIAVFLLIYRYWHAHPHVQDQEGVIRSELSDGTFLRPRQAPELERDIDLEAQGPRFVEWTGTLFVPHDGALILRADVHGAGTAQVRLDGGPPASYIDGSPVRGGEPRLFVGPGPHDLSVRYALPSGQGSVRLLWLPPGRRAGDCEEYIAPSALAPGPASAYASDQTHAAVFAAAGMVATGVLVVLAGLLLILFRRRLAKYLARLRSDPWARRDLAILLALVVVAWAVRLVGLMRQGQTWDEDTYWSAGRNYLINLVSLDFRPQSWLANLEHPPWTKYLAGYMALFYDGYAPARALFALLGAATCGVVYLCGRDLYDRAVGVTAAVIAIVLPPLIAHSKVVGHETPSTLFFTLAVWRFLRAQREAQGWRGYTGAGVWAGLCIGTRFSAGLVLALLGFLAIGHALARSSRSPRERLAELLRAIATPVVAVVVLVATWPRLWSQPIAHLLETRKRLFGAHDPEYFLGQLVGGRSPTPVPLSYFPVYLSATLPPLVLLALVLFAARAIARRKPSDAIVVVWMIVPLGVAFSPIVQDGVRYVLPALPAFAIAAAAGALWPVSLLAEKLQRPIRAAVIAGFAVAGTVACAFVHPYYLDYYNLLWGGPARAERDHLFEISWWGEGIGEATAWVNAHAPGRAHVTVRFNPSHMTWLRHDLQRTDDPGAADYVMQNQLGTLTPTPPPGFTTAYTVQADGAPLAVVFARAPH